MLDKVVSLAVEGKAEALDASLVVAVHTDIPDHKVRLRLWDEFGRNPQPAKQDPPGGARWLLQGVRPGCTLTWSVRLASQQRDRFELRLEVLRDERPLPGGSFSYSGPLEGIEERNGRFHFGR